MSILSTEKTGTDFIQNFQALTSNISEGVMITDAQENIIWLNKAFEEICGTRLDDLIGKKPNVLQGIRTDIISKQKIKKSIDNNQTVDTEILNYKPDKTPFWIKLSITPVLDNKGDVTNYIGFSHDISNEKKIESELLRSERHYKELFDLSPTVLWLHDPSTHKFVEVNQAAIDLYGYSREEYKKMTLLDVRPAEDVAHHIQDVTTTNGYNKSRGIWRHLKKNGEIIYVDIRSSHLDYNGRECILAQITDVTEKLKREQQISEHVKKISIIIESITDIFYVIGSNYDLLYTNKATETLTGLTKEELLGKNVWKVFEDANLKLPKYEFEKAFKENVNSYFEMEYNGNIYAVDIYPSELGLSVSGKDITDKKLHEEQTRKNAKFIKEISDSMPGYIYQFEYDPDFTPKLNYASEKASDYWKCEIKDVMDDVYKLGVTIHEDDVDKVRKWTYDAVRELKNLDIKYRAGSRNGDIRSVRASAIPTRLSNGNTILNGIIYDITKEENYYSQLAEANMRYEYLSKATHEMIWELEVSTGVIKLSGAYKEILGHEYDDNRSNMDEWKSILDPADMDRVLSSVNAALENDKEKYWECGYRIFRRDGITSDVFSKGYIIYDEEKNTPVKIIGSTQDVTEMKKIQNEKDKVLSDLVNRNKMLEQFTFMVSHNLRAPIANMLGVSKILEDKELEESVKEQMLDLNLKSVHRLNEVVGDMNEILSIRKNKIAKKEKVEFQNILNEIVEIELGSMTEVDYNDLKILTDFDNAGSINSIRSYMYGIFQNLISNSIKYRSKKDSFIKITSDEDEKNVYLTFEDNGIGIDLGRNKNKIFGLYNRFHTEKEGKGMGLYMVKSHVEELDGEIKVESEVGKGTKFSIKLRK